MQNIKNLFRSESSKKICGVCSGLARYLNIDATSIRIMTALITVCTAGAMVLAYIILAFIIPKEPI